MSILTVPDHNAHEQSTRSDESPLFKVLVSRSQQQVGLLLKGSKKLIHNGDEDAPVHEPGPVHVAVPPSDVD